MRKSGLSVFFSLAALSAFASPVNNPAAPGLMQSGIFSSPNPWIKVTTGYMADYVSNMPLKLSTGSAAFDPKESFKHFGLHSQMASFSLVLLQRLEAYTLLGGSKEHLEWHAEPHTSLYSSLFDFQTSYHFSWAGGVRIVLLQWGQTFFQLRRELFCHSLLAKILFQIFKPFASSSGLGKTAF